MKDIDRTYLKCRSQYHRDSYKHRHENSSYTNSKRFHRLSRSPQSLKHPDIVNKMVLMNASSSGTNIHQLQLRRNFDIIVIFFASHVRLLQFTDMHRRYSEK